jgi:hypothetical protein
LCLIYLRLYLLSLHAPSVVVNLYQTQSGTYFVLVIVSVLRKPDLIIEFLSLHACTFGNPKLVSNSIGNLGLYLLSLHAPSVSI